MQFYTDLLGSEVRGVEHLFPQGARLDDSQFVQLVAAPSREDVRKAVFAIGVNKFPDPDGLGSLFFRSAWGDVGEDVVEAVMEFFHRGRLLWDFNNTFIALIPKVDAPTRVSDFRPISCCNVLLKVIMKIRTQKVKDVMSDLISYCQCAFRGYGRADNSPHCTIKVDIHKTFDSIS